MTEETEEWRKAGQGCRGKVGIDSKMRRSVRMRGTEECTKGRVNGYVEEVDSGQTDAQRC